MTAAASGGRGWPRVLGLVVVAAVLAVAQPFVVMVVAFAILTVTGGNEQRLLFLLVLPLYAFIAVFYPGSTGGAWYLERGWAVLITGWFVSLTMLLPRRGFLMRALASVAGAGASAVLVLAIDGGWARADAIMAEQIEASALASLELLGALAFTGAEAELSDAFARAAEIQGVLFPAFAALSSVAALGVAWWAHVQTAGLPGPALRPLREFRFADPLIWLFISGLALMLVAEWSAGWGRLGTNLLAFMGGLYILRGAAVLLVLWGGISVGTVILLSLAVLLTGPFVALAAMLIGVGDSWLDLRSRVTRKIGESA